MLKGDVFTSNYSAKFGQIPKLTPTRTITISLAATFKFVACHLWLTITSNLGGYLKTSIYHLKALLELYPFEYFIKSLEMIF